MPRYFDVSKQTKEKILAGNKDKEIIEQRRRTRMSKKVCDKCGRKIKEISRGRAHRLWITKEGKLCGNCYKVNYVKRSVPGNINISGRQVKCKFCNSIMFTKATVGETFCSTCKKKLVFDRERYNEYSSQRYRIRKEAKK